MITGLLVIGLFFFATILAFLERYMGEFRKPAYFFLGAMLILVAGLREIGIDPDSANYEYNFLYYDSASSVNDSVYLLMTCTFFSCCMLFSDWYSNSLHSGN